MAKRKQHPDPTAEVREDHDSNDISDSEDGSESDLTGVYQLAEHFVNHNLEGITADELLDSQGDFEVFAPQEQDFHGIKHLLRLLFNADKDLFDLSALANLILSQPTVGSTLKITPDEDTPTHLEDPVSILTALNLNEHRTRPEIKTVIEYIASKAAGIPDLAQLPQLFAADSKAQVALVVTERLPTPFAIVPAMYEMLLEEIRWAVDDREPYRFTHYLVLSKVEMKVRSKLDGDVVMESGPASKKSKSAGTGKSKASKGDGPSQRVIRDKEELDVFSTRAGAVGNFDYSNAAHEGAADAKRALSKHGSVYKGNLMLFEAKAFEAAVGELKGHAEQVALEQAEREKKARELFKEVAGKLEKKKLEGAANGQGKTR